VTVEAVGLVVVVVFVLEVTVVDVRVVVVDEVDVDVEVLHEARTNDITITKISANQVIPFFI